MIHAVIANRLVQEHLACIILSFCQEVCYSRLLYSSSKSSHLGFEQEQEHNYAFNHSLRYLINVCDFVKN